MTPRKGYDYFMDHVSDIIAEHLRKERPAPPYNPGEEGLDLERLCGYRRAVHAVADAFAELQGEEFIVQDFIDLVNG